MTGAAGFIGRHLVRALLERGDEVVAWDRASLPRDAWPGSGPRRVEADLGDATAAQVLAGADTVYHLAACHLGVATPDEEFVRVNVEAAAGLVRAAARAGVRRFVHCSSVGVYGRLRETPADEDSPCHPNLVYERTKLAGERAVLEAAGESGLEAVVLRPAWVYGPGCPRTEKLFRAIARGRFVVAGSGERLRHGVYIGDMVDAFQLAADAAAAVGRVVIVGDREAVPVRTWVDEIARQTGARRPLSIPLWLMELAARGVELAFRPLGKEPPISRRTLEFFTGNTSFRIDRARALLGFEPRYDPASGLAETHRALAAASSAR